MGGYGVDPEKRSLFRRCNVTAHRFVDSDSEEYRDGGGGNGTWRAGLGGEMFLEEAGTSVKPWRAEYEDLETKEIH